MTTHDLIHIRELQCFCLKTSYESAQLGIGVHIQRDKRQAILESEFDLLSHQAFCDFQIRRSVHGLPFEHWLPLPISRQHYISIKDKVDGSLKEVGQAARLSTTKPVDVIYHFMNDIVVKLSQQAAESSRYSPWYYEVRPESALKRISKKAIDSYYHLFHLLLCCAAADDAIVRSIDETLNGFLQGQTSKRFCPNLGPLLVAILISNLDWTQELLWALIKETITRNVVWMLDRRGARMPELSYMEASGISDYRLQKTFEANKTSYWLLMFMNLFRLMINRGTGSRKKSITQLRDETFDAHGAPPRGEAGRLANEIKRLEAVNSFQEFFEIMGVEKIPTASELTTFLRDCVEDSMRKGYSHWRLSQKEALGLRRRKDRDVEVRKDPKPEWRVNNGGGTFFSGEKRAPKIL